MKIIIGQACDSVTFVIVEDGEVRTERFYFNQEDTFEGMVKFFEALGIESEYEEWY